MSEDVDDLRGRINKLFQTRDDLIKARVVPSLCADVNCPNVPIDGVFAYHGRKRNCTPFDTNPLTRRIRDITALITNYQYEGQERIARKEQASMAHEEGTGEECTPDVASTLRAKIAELQKYPHEIPARTVVRVIEPGYVYLAEYTGSIWGRLGPAPWNGPLTTTEFLQHIVDTNAQMHVVTQWSRVR